MRTKGKGSSRGEMRCMAGTMDLSRVVKFPFRAALEAPVSHALPAPRVCAEVTHARQWKRGLGLCFGICLPFLGQRCCRLSALPWTDTKKGVSQVLLLQVFAPLRGPR